MEKYVAFISYSQRDRPRAQWLHRKVETYRVPARLRSKARAFGGTPGRLSPVFLDRAELSSSPDLAAAVRAGLEGARYLIVVCSPHSARSRWVNEEIRYFKALGGAERILCLIIDGHPGAATRAGANPDDECFPPALGEPIDASGTPMPEPLAADLRPGMDEPRDALLKVISALLGLNFNDLRQREQVRRQRRLAMVASALAAGCVVLTALTAFALLARNEAQRQRTFAEQQSLTARRTADFMKSLFEVSDPSEARGSSITAREILDRGVRQIETGLRDQPLVRADLTTTLGEVYTNLGLYRSGTQLLERAVTVPGQDLATQVRQTTALAETEFLQGHYEHSDTLFRSAATSIEKTKPLDQAMLARVLSGRGELMTEIERYAQAEALFKRSLGIATDKTVDLPPDVARNLEARNMEGLATNAYHEGKLDEAEAEFRKAIELRVALSGERHPKVAESLTVLGAIEYGRGRNAQAAAYFERALPIYKQVLGAKHPDVGMTLNNLARIYVERRQFTKAEPMLQESADLMLAQKDETNDNMSFVYSNLALVHLEMGDYKTAEPLYEKALRAAVANNHRLHGPILTDLAALECRTSRAAAGLARLDEARPIIAARYPNDAWRLALVDNVRGACLMSLNRLAEAEPLLAASTPILLEKWGSDGLYGADAVQLAIRYYALAGNQTKLAEYRALERR